MIVSFRNMFIDLYLARLAGFFFGSLICFHGFSKPLDYYRNVLVHPKAGHSLVEEAQARKSTLMTLLSAAEVDKAQSVFKGSDAQKLIEQIYSNRFNTLGSNGTKASRSLYLKKALHQIAVDLRRVELRTVPDVFDPGMFSYEVDSKIAEKRYDFCRQKLSQKMDLLVPELISEMARQQAMNNASVTKDQSAFHAQIVKAFAQLISPKLTSKLGDLVGVEYVDGVIAKLRFLDGAKGRVYPVTLGMLINARALLDYYYVLVLHSVKRFVAAGLEKGPNQVSGDKSKIYTVILPFLNETYQEALFINKKISGLYKSELDGLIAMMLQVTLDDVPTALEFKSADDNQSFELVRPNSSLIDLVSSVMSRDGVKQSEALKTLNEHMLKKFKITVPLTSDEARIDFMYYQSLHGQQSLLEEHLRHEAARLQADQKLLDDM